MHAATAFNKSVVFRSRPAAGLQFNHGQVHLHCTAAWPFLWVGLGYITTMGFLWRCFGVTIIECSSDQDTVVATKRVAHDVHSGVVDTEDDSVSSMHAPARSSSSFKDKLFRRKSQQVTPQAPSTPSRRPNGNRVVPTPVYIPEPSRPPTPPPPPPPDEYEILYNKLSPLISQFKDGCNELQRLAENAESEASGYRPLVLVKREVTGNGRLAGKLLKHVGLHLGKGVVVELVKADPNLLNDREARVATVLTVLSSLSLASYASTIPMIARFVGKLASLSSIKSVTMDNITSMERIQQFNDATDFLKLNGLISKDTVLAIHQVTDTLSSTLQAWRNPGKPLAYGGGFNSNSFAASTAGQTLTKMSEMLGNKSFNRLVKVLEAGSNAYKLMTERPSDPEMTGIVRLTHIYSFARPPPATDDGEVMPALQPSMYPKVIITPERLDDDERLSHRKVLYMTSRALGRIEYRLFTQNCETMARFLATGKADSVQAKVAGAAIGAGVGAGLAGLALAAGPIGWLGLGIAGLVGAAVGDAAVSNDSLDPALQRIKDGADNWGAASWYACDAEREVMQDLIATYT